MVYPSGLALATCDAATAPPAPTLFSTTIVWPHCPVSSCPSARDSISAVPPAGKGEIRRTGWVGQSPAKTGVPIRKQAIQAAIQRTTSRVNTLGALHIFAFSLNYF